MQRVLMLGLGLILIAACAPVRSRVTHNEGSELLRNGRDAFSLNCSSCHTVERNGLNKLGPNLFAVVGKLSGTNITFEYSGALADGKILWTEQNLDRFLIDPQEIAPGTVMQFRGLSLEGERMAIIAYLKSHGNEGN